MPDYRIHISMQLKNDHIVSTTTIESHESREELEATLEMMRDGYEKYGHDYRYEVSEV